MSADAEKVQALIEKLGKLIPVEALDGGVGTGVILSMREARLMLSELRKAHQDSGGER